MNEAADFKSAVSTYFTIEADLLIVNRQTKTPRNFQGATTKQSKSWRRDPESNWANRICNPGHNRFAIAPF
jgi:hypothetical protein